MQAFNIRSLDLWKILSHFQYNSWSKSLPSSCNSFAFTRQSVVKIPSPISNFGTILCLYDLLSLYHKSSNVSKWPTFLQVLFHQFFYDNQSHFGFQKVRFLETRAWKLKSTRKWKLKKIEKQKLKKFFLRSGSGRKSSRIFLKSSSGSLRKILEICK